MAMILAPVVILGLIFVAIAVASAALQDVSAAPPGIIVDPSHAANLYGIRDGCDAGGGSIRALHLRWHLPARVDMGHVWQEVGNTFVAIYAGLLTGDEIARMNGRGTWGLLGEVHSNR